MNIVRRDLRDRYPFHSHPPPGAQPEPKRLEDSRTGRALFALAITVIVIVLAAWFGDVALTGSGW